MASINESRDVERVEDLILTGDRVAASERIATSDRVATRDDFAAQLARVVFEWWPALPSSTPPPMNDLWMSRNVRRSLPAS